MLNFNRKSFNLLLVVLLFFSGLSLPSGLVVCYGADGHIAIESGEMDCNDAPQQIDHSQEPQHTLTESHCGNCTDIPLILQSLETVTPEAVSLSLDSQPVFLATHVETLPNVFLQTATEGQLPQPPPLIDPFLKAYRTVVLLI